MECDFCLDMDVEEYLDGYEVDTRIATEPFKCYECHRSFPAGVEQEIAIGENDGDSFESLTCIDCHHIAQGLICGGRVHGGLYEAIEAMMDDGAKFTTACLSKIEAASAKAYLVSRINQLNGLAGTNG